MKPVAFRPLAEHDIDEAVDYLFNENPRAALRLLDAFRKACNAISRNPGIGSLRFSDALPAKGLRFLAVKDFSYLVFYFERRDHIDVVRILHGKRDIPDLLLEDLPQQQ